MSGTFNSYGSLMSAAQMTAGGAQIVLPPVIWIATEFKLANGNPVNLEKAAESWDKTAKGLQKTAQELKQSLQAIPAQAWTAQDRDAYAKKVDEFCQQLDIVATFCQAVSIALIAYAYAMLVYAIFAMGMGVFVAALAVAFIAAAAGVFTAVACPEIEAVAATCLTITTVATGILGAAASIAGMVFQGGAMLAAIQEYTHGDKGALTDFRQAEATGAATALANGAQNAINAGLTVAGARGMGKGSPISNVDLDADRNANHTWNIGGGATYKTPTGTEITGGGHVKWGDHGLAGGDLSGGVKVGGVASVNGNAEYTDEDGIGQGKGGEIKYGAQGTLSTPDSLGFNNPTRLPDPNGGKNDSLPLPSAGITGGVSGSHNFGDGSGTLSGNAGVQVNGQDGYKRTETYADDGKGGYKTTDQTDTPFSTKKKEDKAPPWDL
ncbi:hypothetical protein [Actinomadura rayongensis]|uniref:Uncharacterized protein n=1 Tax=Actinomadura rayongensis TaxID=1429076 RepID=A0A6I4W3Q0_9ACTN|nr:hypothetical protein [Actinomadura rayongensis]MXQ64797.1 hypothetical protein [Actinomadura rayongensis]